LATQRVRLLSSTKRQSAASVGARTAGRFRLFRYTASRWRDGVSVLATRSEDGNWVWSFELNQRGGKTRLTSRNRFRLPTVTAKIGMLPMEPALVVMAQKMLRGIKERAERYAAQRWEETRA
jgi:hypothetical protein